jgi:hypothetical protein
MMIEGRRGSSFIISNRDPRGKEDDTSNTGQVSSRSWGCEDSGENKVLTFFD